MLSSLKSLRPARDAVFELRAELDAIRDEVAARAAAIEAIDTAPVPIDEAMTGFSDWMDRAATEAVDRLSPNHLLAPGRAIRGLDLPAGHAASDILLGLLIAANRDAVTDVIAGQLRDLTHDRETIATADRPALREKARDALLRAELAEESVCRALDNMGVEFRRRPEADPRAVLAHDEMLVS